MQDNYDKIQRAPLPNQKTRAFSAKPATSTDNGFKQVQAVSISVDNPATKEIIGKVPGLGGAETKRAIEAAKRRFPLVEQEDRERARRRPPPLVRPCRWPIRKTSRAS